MTTHPTPVRTPAVIAESHPRQEFNRNLGHENGRHCFRPLMMPPIAYALIIPPAVPLDVPLIKSLMLPP